MKIRMGTSDVSVAIAAFVEGEFEPLRGLANVKTIIDGGANIGTTAVALSEMFPAATIFAIEPEKENFSLLVENTRNRKNVVCLNYAIASRAGTGVLRDRETGPWGYCITEAQDGETVERETVSCIALNDLILEHSIDRVDILKLDIEGGEKQVLETGNQWIDLVDVLVVELHDRIVPGCSDAFHMITDRFERIEQSGEKQIAYRYDEVNLTSDTRS